MARIGLESVSYATDYDWSADTATPTAIALGSIRREGLEIGQPEAYTSRTADLLDLLDGIRWQGAIWIEEGTTIIADNTQFWLIVSPLTGTDRAYGGTNGCKGYLLEEGLKALDGGRLYQQFVFAFAADSVANGIHDYTPA